MYAIIGATGNVGYATASALRQAGLPVKAIVRDAARAVRLQDIGCEIAVADLHDLGALAEAIAGADAVQVVVPVPPRAADPAAAMRASVDSLTRALLQAGPKTVLAISDYGAHVAHDIGMPGIFHELEARLAQLAGHTIILRSAEHMHNWLRNVPAALESGVLMTFQDPVDMEHPTIAAQDLGVIAADLLQHPAGDADGAGVQVVHAEGSRRYAASDVAAALSELAGRPIQAKAIPRSHWEAAMGQKMPASLAGLLIGANEAKNKGALVEVEPGGVVRYGATVLIDALRSLLR